MQTHSGYKRALYPELRIVLGCQDGIEHQVYLIHLPFPRRGGKPNGSDTPAILEGQDQNQVYLIQLPLPGVPNTVAILVGQDIG